MTKTRTRRGKKTTAKRRGKPAATARVGAPYVTRNTTRTGGRTYSYVVLRYDEVDENGRKQPRSLLSLGSEQQVDEERAKSLADVMRDFVRPGSTMTVEELRALLGAAKPTLKILCSRQFGLRLLVEQAFADLGFKEVLAEIDSESRAQFQLERLVFGMVLQMVVSPGSKLRAAERLGDTVFYPEGDGMSVHHYYRALDLLQRHHERVEAKLRERLEAQGLEFKAKALDTTSSYFETDFDDLEWEQIAREDDPDRQVPPVVNDPPLRMRGYSKDKQPNKPQIVVEQVVSEGYVIDHQTHPGNTSDSSLLPKTAERLARLGLTDDVVLTADAGLNTARAREALSFEDVDWVMGEGRSKTKLAKEVLRCGGRFSQSPDNPDLGYRAHKRGDRLFVVRRNRAERKRELRVVDRHVAKVRKVLAESDRAEKPTSKVLTLMAHATYKRYVKRSKDDPERLVLNTKAVERAKREAGKSVISTSLLSLEPRLVDELYRLQFDVEDAFRTQKTGLNLRPIRHRRADRIKAHVLVAVMALNVTRHIERKTGMTLFRLRDLLTSITVQQVEVGGRAGVTFWQTVELSSEQKAVFKKLGFDLPLPRFQAELA